ncbi:MAG TPA: dienelactone hydrolase family protein, partial [Acidimicrobiales bacterium]|nr:dienelactone hydrolase family protein [Acidimicrobiales bacterium]
MHCQTVTLATPDGDMALYEAVPDPRGRAAVIVIQEAFGVNDHIEDVCRRLADAGYHAVAPHLFHRSGGGTVPYDRLEEVMKHLGELSDDGMLVDFDATLAHLRSAGWADSAIGAVGFCMGGR